MDNRPDKYMNPHAKDIVVRDQGERGCSAGISTAYAYEMMKKREEDYKSDL